MTAGPTRRALITTIATGALVVGFDPVTRTWIANAAETGTFVGLPPLDGRVVTDPTTLGQAADDFGHLVHLYPAAVLEPGSVSDIVAMVGYCRDHGIQVAPRGQGHTTNGQAQVAGGLVIDMAPLDTVEVRGDLAVAQAGARWSRLLQVTLARGLTPAVLTDYLELSIGGTLSVGGFGGQTHHYGAQVDSVVELEVVTGAAQRLTCSAQQNPDLFNAVLAGLGQSAIITSATIKLRPAPTTVRHYLLSYPSVAALTADQRRVVRDGRFAYVEGQIEAPSDSSDWGYVLEAVAFFTGTTPPDDARLLGDLSFRRGTQEIQDMAYFDFLDRLAPGVAFLESNGEWYRPHPWWNAFLPDSRTDAFVESALKDLSPSNIGASGVILLYPFPRANLHRPLLRVPDEELVFLFSILRTASPDAASPQTMIEANRTLYQRARAIGGFQYPIGTIPTSHGDWRTHYGPVWPALVAARQRYDPNNILTPGQGIFRPSAP